MPSLPVRLLLYPLGHVIHNDQLMWFMTYYRHVIFQLTTPFIVVVVPIESLISATSCINAINGYQF